VVAALAARVRDDDRHREADQFADETRQALALIVGVAGFDHHVLTFGEPSRCQTLTEAGAMGVDTASDVLRRNPITGFVGCCARTASAQVAAAPPISVMNSRRLMSHIGLFPPWAPGSLPRAQPASERRARSLGQT
jgi:hypothetical protein